MTNWKKSLTAVILATLVLSLLIGGTASAVFIAGPAPTYNGTAPKYVFLFIGDGMSDPQISSAEMFLGKKANLSDLVGGGGLSKLSFSNFPIAGAAATLDSTSFIPDSASTATSIASGHKTLSGVINMDESKTVKFTPISQKMQDMGYKVGIVSSVPLNHATPAAFYAQVPSRRMNYEISMQAVASGFDYFGGGGFMDPTGKEGNERHVHEVFAEAGYTVPTTKNDIMNLGPDSGKVLAVNPDLAITGPSMPYEVDRKAGDLSLADFVRKGIDVLDNPNGFFFMVEAGKIDWANHANDGATSIHDTLAFDRSVQEALRFYAENPNETLILVTGDHECGGMSIGFAGTGYATFFDKLDKVNMSFEMFDANVLTPYVAAHTPATAELSHLAKDIKYAYGLLLPGDPDAEYHPEMVLTDNEIAKLEAALVKQMQPREERNYTDDEKILYGGYNPLSVTLTHLLNNKAGITYSSYSHTGLPVPVYAYGLGQDLFTGYYDNTDIFNRLVDILGIR